MRFNVAEPVKAQAVEAVRRRIPEAAAARVEAETALSSHTVYGLLRMKRGQLVQIVRRISALRPLPDAIITSSQNRAA